MTLNLALDRLDHEWDEAFEHIHFNESKTESEAEEEETPQFEGNMKKKKTGYYQTYREKDFEHDSWKKKLEKEVNSRY